MDRLPTPQLGNVEIWIARNEHHSSVLDALEKTLNRDELRVSQQFKFEKDRISHVFSQGVLRNILARYLDQPAADLEFETNAFGKPFLKGSSRGAELTFNVSHSKELVVLAVTRKRAIGVDVEHIRHIDDIDSIARHYFTPMEQGLLCSDIPHERAFYTCWTRKEAYIKAVGKGLSIPLTSFDTSMQIGSSGRHLATTPDCPEVNSWWLSDLGISKDYAGALVNEGERPNISYHNWDLGSA